MTTMLITCLLLLDPSTITVERDNTEVTVSAKVRIAAEFVLDADGNGVILVNTDGVELDFAGQTLRGAAPGTPPEQYAGYGVRVTAQDVTIRNLKVSGFRGGIYASHADGLTIEDCDVSDNVRQRLQSTPAAEDLSDWLYPHHNDENEWLHNYGAGIYVEESEHVTVRRCRARNGQNAFCGRKVNHSKLYDNDFSFLSGWGIALYRSNDSMIAHNSCDFCMRGYSHGVYSRGQDSAGILFFEQCSDNVVAYNSATHSGDGFFGYAGNEVMDGKTDDPHAGCNRNLLYGNDFSYSAANAIEMTFSQGNIFAENVLNAGNYGIWGGYSSGTQVAGNTIEDNLIAGIAVEHGSDWWIARNRFRNNRRGIQLWWDDDKDLLAKPWARQNSTDSKDYTLEANTFDGNKLEMELRKTTGVTVVTGDDWKIGQKFDVDADEASDYVLSHLKTLGHVDEPENVPGERKAVGLRKHLAGREHIVMTEYGPYDWEGPYLHFVGATDEGDVYRLLGKESLKSAKLVATDENAVAVTSDDSGPQPRVIVSAKRDGTIAPYKLRVTTDSMTFEREGMLTAAEWAVQVFAANADPRSDLVTWHAEAEASTSFTTRRLSLPYRNGGPSDLPGVPDSVKNAKLPRDHFGTIVTAELHLPAGKWRLQTTSDDGVRLWADGDLLIDNWTWHGPTVDQADLTLAELRTVKLRIEHFELDGYAMLAFEIAPAHSE